MSLGFQGILIFFFLFRLFQRTFFLIKLQLINDPGKVISPGKGELTAIDLSFFFFFELKTNHCSLKSLILW